MAGSTTPEAQSTIYWALTQTKKLSLIAEEFFRRVADATGTPNQMMHVGPRTGEESGIQPQEKMIYRKPVEGIGLREAEIRKTEWAAEQELKPAGALRDILTSRFGRLAGAWPSDDLLEMPGAPRL